LDGQRVIIYGGYQINNTNDSLHVLNVKDWEWKKPFVTGKYPAITYSHKANVIGNYMVVSFGKYRL